MRQSPFRKPNVAAEAVPLVNGFRHTKKKRGIFRIPGFAF